MAIYDKIMTFFSAVILQPFGCGPGAMSRG